MRALNFSLNYFLTKNTVCHKLLGNTKFVMRLHILTLIPSSWLKLTGRRKDMTMEVWDIKRWIHTDGFLQDSGPKVTLSVSMNNVPKNKIRRVFGIQNKPQLRSNLSLKQVMTRHGKLQQRIRGKKGIRAYFLSMWRFSFLSTANSAKCANKSAHSISKTIGK